MRSDETVVYLKVGVRTGDGSRVINSTMYLTLGMGKNSASKTMTWLTFTEHSKQKEVHFPLIEVCQPVTYSACWLLFTLHRDSP